MIIEVTIKEELIWSGEEWIKVIRQGKPNINIEFKETKETKETKRA